MHMASNLHVLQQGGAVKWELRLAAVLNLAGSINLAAIPSVPWLREQSITKHLMETNKQKTQRQIRQCFSGMCVLQDQIGQLNICQECSFCNCSPFFLAWT